MVLSTSGNRPPTQPPPQGGRCSGVKAESAKPQIAKHKITNKDTTRARRLRKEMPLAERLLWLRLKEFSKLCGATFRRQHPLPPYVVDFVCLSLKLVIEIDGYSHDLRQRQDQAREDYLLKVGFKTRRFSNVDVLSNPDGVAETILHYVKEHMIKRKFVKINE